MFNITNYNQHPTRPGYNVFKFYQQERADNFKQLLEEENIWFEDSVDDENPDKIHFMFAIRVADHKKVVQLNFIVNGTHRKPTISNSYVRMFVYAVAIGILIMAIAGALLKT